MKSGWIAAIGMAVLTVGSMAWAQVPGPTIPKPVPIPTIPGIRPTIPPIIKECRDPAAISLNYRVVSRPKWPATQGQIRIEGVVKNVGNAEFESNPGHGQQARALLLEEWVEGWGTIKAEWKFTNLAPGISGWVSYERAWNTATINVGEFPPKFVLMIDYDPDTYIDANKKNDDCNQKNNRAELTRETINSTWPR